MAVAQWTMMEWAPLFWATAAQGHCANGVHNFLHLPLHDQLAQHLTEWFDWSSMPWQFLHPTGRHLLLIVKYWVSRPNCYYQTSLVLIAHCGVYVQFMTWSHRWSNLIIIFHPLLVASIRDNSTANAQPANAMSSPSYTAIKYWK